MYTVIGMLLGAAIARLIVHVFSMHGPDDEPIVVEIEDIEAIPDGDLGEIIHPQ